MSNSLSLREQIVQAAIGVMTPIAQSYGATIFRSPAIAIERNQLPAIIVSPDKIQVKKANLASERLMVLRVTAIAKRTDDEACDVFVDRIATDVYQAVVASKNFGGLAQSVQETEVEFEADEADIAVSALPTCFEVLFRTRWDDPRIKG